jgi:amino acid transporter
LPYESKRHIGLLGATGVGVGAIVGGGILALAGAAFAATGPSAVLAFALNGVIAVLTAMSFAEVSSKFPQSGGTYTFAKKVLSVEAAFIVGWVVWFASIVAAVLYAIGFGQFAAVMIDDLWRGVAGESPAWVSGRLLVSGLAIGAVAFYSASLIRKSAAGGMWANIGKVAVFALLVVAGLWAMRGRSAAELGQGLRPFFTYGASGLFAAMGFTFIALQGFDLIAAVAGEIRQPVHNIPRAMFGSLGIALLIYLPLLLIISTVGMAEGESVTAASKAHPETIVARAAQNYLGPTGYWLVMAAGVLAMLSGLQANLFAASRVGMSMACDRTLPKAMARIHSRRGTPHVAVLVTSVVVVAILLVIPDVAAAGAAASLIFLITFALAHWIAILVRQRSGTRPPPFQSPWYPMVPLVGGTACVSLAIYQGLAVPTAGLIAVGWIAIGGLLFLGLFARRARVADAGNAAMDPEMVTLRGRSPLVLAPIVRPDSAAGLVAVAHALAPPGVGRVLLLSVVVVPPQWKPEDEPKPLHNAQAVLGEALRVSASTGVYPETLATVANEPWQEISRVAKTHRCETLLMGLSQIDEHTVGTPLEQLSAQVDCDVVVLRTEKDWQLSDARRILVPTAGRGGHDRLLARLLGSLSRSDERQVTFLRVVPENTPQDRYLTVMRHLQRFAYDLYDSSSEIRLVRGDQPMDVVADAAKECDLLVLGVQRTVDRRKLFGPFIFSLARRVTCPIVVVCRR